MFDLKKFQNLSREQLLEVVTRSYKNNCTQFCVDFTKLFQERDGTQQEVYPKQNEIMNLLSPNERVVVINKCRQCLAGDTYLYTEDGIKTIKELCELNYKGKIWTLNENNEPVLDEIIDIWDTGIQEVYETKLFSGEKIITTNEHKLSTPEGFLPLNCLKKQDEIKVFEGLFGNETVTDEEVIVMGYFITDGCYSNGNPKFTNININYLNEFDNCVKKRYNVKTNWIKKGKGFDIVVSGVGNGNNKPNEYFQNLIDLQMRGVTGANRVLPNKFLNLNKKQTALLLNRMFAGDGWYSLCGGGQNKGRKQTEIGIASLSLEFLQQISFLLSKFGIHVNINEEKPNKKSVQRFYKLRFASISYAQKFFDEIDIYDKHLRLSIISQHIIHKKPNRIKYIKKLENKIQTFDLMTKKHHSYIANGIHVHNSGISTAAAVAKPVHLSMFGNFPDICMVSSTQVQALKVMRRVKDCFNEMPDWLRPNFVKETESELILPNKTRLISLPASPQSIRSYTGCFILDEFAMHTKRESEEIYEAVIPSTTKGGHIIVISTPFGTEGMFYRLVTETMAEISENPHTKFDSKKLFITYEDVPFILHAVKNLGLFDSMTPLMVEQEYLLKFVIDNIDEQFFTKDFILSTLRDMDGRNIPLYTSYKDFGIPYEEYIGDRCENLEKPLDPKYFKVSELREKYDKITAGFDPASTENDSVFKVHGRLRNEYDKWHEIADCTVNRVNTRMHDLIYQGQYVKRFMQAMDVDVCRVDANGIGSALFSYLEKDKELGNRFVGLKMQVEDKYTEYVRVKQRLSEGRIKRKWEENSHTKDMLQQYTNLRLNKLSHSLKAKGALKDDHPYSFLLCQTEMGNNNSQIHFI